MNYLDRIGLLFDFLAFWFATPEILGKERLKKIEIYLERALSCSGIVFFVLISFFFLSLAIPIIAIISDSPILNWMSTSSFVTSFVCGFPLFCVIFFGLMYLVTSLTDKTQKMIINVVKSLVACLADDRKIRRRSLAIGAIFFVLGFILQFISTF